MFASPDLPEEKALEVEARVLRITSTMGTPKRSSGRLTRKRVMSSRVREVDESALASARAAAVAALEDDMAPEVSSASEFEIEEEELAQRRTKRARRSSGGDARSKRTKTKGIARHNMPLQQVLETERGLELPHGMVSFEALATQPSVKPARKLCSVCGHKAPYTCSRCQARFCCLKCSNVHNDTRCLKFTVG